MKNFAIAIALTCSLMFAGSSFGQQYYSTVPSYGYSTQTYGTTYSAPTVYSTPTYRYSSRANTPVRNFFGRVRSNVSTPRYSPSTTTYGNVYAAPVAQPKYQQVTETRYKKVCKGRAGCSYEPYQYTYMKRIQ